MANLLDPDGYYATLGVDPSATDATIKKAYRRKMREWHPDRNSSSDAERMTVALTIAGGISHDASQ